MSSEVLAYIVLPIVLFVTIKIAKQNSYNASVVQKEDSIKHKEIEAKIREFELLVKKEQIKAETIDSNKHNKSPMDRLVMPFPVNLLDNTTKNYLIQEQTKLMQHLSQVDADYDQEMRVRNIKVDKWIPHALQKERRF